MVQKGVGYRCAKHGHRPKVGRAVGATVPDPFLNHASFPTSWQPTPQINDRAQLRETGGREKGTGTFCRNGPSGASHKRFLSPFRGRTLTYLLGGQIMNSVARFGTRAWWGTLSDPIVGCFHVRGVSRLHRNHRI